MVYTLLAYPSPSQPQIPFPPSLPRAMTPPHHLPRDAACQPTDPNIDPNSGFNPQTKTFHSLRPNVPLHPLDQPLSITQFSRSLLPSPLPSEPFLINSVTEQSLSYADFLSQTRSLSFSLRTFFPALSQNDVAYILPPSSLQIPVLYFSLMSLGVTISPANPLSSAAEISHQTELINPKIAFATSQTAGKIPRLPLGTVLIDSPEFLSWLTQHSDPESQHRVIDSVRVSQSDPAAILFSSGTTGKVKGVMLTHRNLIALIAGFHFIQRQVDTNQPEPHPISLFILPFFHVFGFFMLIRAFTNGETLVSMERFELDKMLAAVEKYKITYMPVSPPLVVALVKSELTKNYDLSSLLYLGSGGAPLGKDVVDRFKEKFPNVEIGQGYGLTETGGAAARMITPEEAKQLASVGRLTENMEAKIVDPQTGEVLAPGERGELWLRGPTIMRGYVGNESATAETLTSDGWLKTGDLCYFDHEGFLYIVDRLKELIKYKAYQVAPAELEQLLQSHPEIADAAVIPYPDEDAGEIPMAYVVRKPGSNITEAQVMDSIAKQVTPYKKIRRVAFINAIPKSPAGKILRRELVNHALSRVSSRL